MTQKTKKGKTITVREVLERTPMPAQFNQNYANQAKISAAGAEIYIDFLLLSPSLNKSEPVAEHVQRIIFPISNTKNLLKALETVIAHIETDLAEAPDEILVDE